MNKPWKVFSTSALVVALSVSMAIPAFAANGDMVDKTTKTTYLASDYRSNTATMNDLLQHMFNGDQFSYEYGSQNYKYDAFANKVTSLMSTMTPEQAKAQAATDSSLLDTTAPTALSVASVSAINSTTLGVAFNRALTSDEQSKAQFAVTYNNTAFNISAVTWSTDGMTAQFSRQDAAKLAAGTYAVSVTGVSTDALTSSVTVNAETATSIELATTRVAPAAGQNIAYTVKNQYGEAMTVAPGAITVYAFNQNDNTNRGITGTLINSMDFHLANVGDVVKVTAYLTANPAVTISSNVTVANISTGAITLADPVLPTGAARLTVNTAHVTMPVTVTDDAGAPIQLAPNVGPIVSGTANNIGNGLTLSFNNITAVAVNAQHQLDFTLGAAAGPASVTITNPATGDVQTKNFTVVAVSDTATITMTAPTTAIRVGGGTVNIPFTLADQYGNAMTTASLGWDPTDVQLNSSNTAVATVTWAGNNLQVTPVAAGNATIYATVVTPVANAATATNTLAITVQSTAQPTNIALSGTPTTSLAEGQTVAAGATTGALKFAITDQDGNPVNLAAAGAAGVKANLTVTDPGTVLTAPAAAVLKAADMSGTVGTTNGITVTAAAATGNATITAQLFVDANNNDILDSGETLLGSVSVPYTVSTNQLNKGAISVIAGATGSGDFSGAYAAVNTNTTLTYALQDQAGQALTTAAAVPVVWTITNTGTTAMTVNDGTTKTLAAGATATYTTQSTVGAAATSAIQINSASENQAKVSVAATGVSTPATSTLTWTDAVVGASQTYTGTVQSFDATAHW
ncbi:hypothetical protein REC12_10090, partial [Desulfosporosinus sp. PR]|uniref:beta strand repeat-containing protein n=1 Tax=Candidatus Desulfosporosinus nitrosoreducens TaxID=3401928 RepID=UPI0027EFB722